MKINIICILILLTVSIGAEVPENWESLALEESSIILTYVENDDGIPGILAHLPLGLESFVLLERIWDPDDISNQVKNLKAREIEEETETSRIIKYKVKVLWATFEYRLQWNFDKDRQKISWKMLDGDLECLEGYWQVLEEGPYSTYVEYQAFTRPKLGFLNSFLKPIYLKELRKYLIEKQRLLRD